MNETLHTLLQHRSIRHYDSKPVPEDMLQTILTAATRGATCGNMQLYSIIVNKDEEFKKQVAPLHFNQSAVIEAPVILTFCADFHRFIQWCNMRNATPGYNNMQSYTWAVVDAVIAAQNAVIAAEAMGLGTCYMGTVTYNVKPLCQLYHLPQHVVPVACITIGYPAEQPELTDRLPVEAVVHSEIYHDYSADDINRLYSEKENSEFTKQLLQENQLDNLAQIFTQRRYTKADNEHFAQELVEFLIDQDFLQK